ncbi:MAG TPA: type II CAAX endopeptidase family protein [Anaerolineaceae bacterium]|jgi:membrane protease YdiL (CAAX protease family)|nr:type II CAAX endopeptidase family protein [Anaerolineaceae bacterium]
MTNPFWNPTEKRARSIWRLALQAAFMLVAAILVSIIPLGFIAIVSTAIPLGSWVTDIGVTICLLLAVLISLWLAGLILDHRPLADFGLHLSRDWWLDFFFGLALGAVLLGIIFCIELAAGWITIPGTLQVRVSGPSFGFVWGLVLMQFISVGIYEELWFRGYILRNLAEGLNFGGKNPRTALIIAYVVSSAVFGLFHIINPNASFMSTFNIILAGLFIGLGFILTGELAIPIGIHITWNFFQGAVFGFPVSGTTSAATLIGIQQAGPELWTGGAFGPEAGLTGFLAMALGSLLIWLWVRWRRGAVLQNRLAVYKPKM